ncbi:hypothetical protein Agabi119p4_8520 [Agaricus bisporus var. burnettii]|uniref:Uncharacterized protein n=1 Tax=Agaricus bisporus var. burnettii TaxID=192524 RepID=A0A8H7C5Z4_AGABI|nr:hypothetical protein Agabi119p4_8520 [Agaricus bisporus var. burnettii]
MWTTGRSKSLQQQSGDVAAWRKTTRNLNKLTSAHPRRRHGSTPASDPPNATPAHAAPAPLHPAPPAHRRSRFPTTLSRPSWGSPPLFLASTSYDVIAPWEPAATPLFPWLQLGSLTADAANSSALHFLRGRQAHLTSPSDPAFKVNRAWT